MGAKWLGVVTAFIICYIGYAWIDRFDQKFVRGKRVLVTGASAGIGESVAYHYARMGATVLVSARREALLKKVVAKCQELSGGKEHYYITSDMSKLEDTENVIKAAETMLGGLDILVLNHIAPYTMGYWTGRDNLTTINYKTTVNFLSYVHLFSHALPLLRKSPGSSVVVVSSLLAWCAQKLISLCHDTLPKPRWSCTTEAQLRFKHIGLSFIEATIQALDDCANFHLIPYLFTHLTSFLGSPVQSDYAATKFAINGFFTSLRGEFHLQEDDISITICYLGPIATKMGLAILANRGTFGPKVFEDMVLMDQDEAALAVVKSAAIKENELYYPYLIKLCTFPGMKELAIRMSYSGFKQAVENTKYNRYVHSGK
ncbi:hydroxysteroid 11-beta-dehydrogenase 1-like protein [Lineus longissimus]|uniref:hydroxysteroid 11-beta-dehydrogenase 1-like protein n=1 Tax=Lineus longissimus TaxID=88925 RepID=UPI00315C9FA5